MVERAKAGRQIRANHVAIERWHIIGVGKGSKTRHQAIRLERRAALARQSVRNSADRAIAAGALARSAVL